MMRRALCSAGRFATRTSSRPLLAVMALVIVAALAGVPTWSADADAPPQGVGLLTGDVAPPPKEVDLTLDGTADWCHWGYIVGTSILNRNADARDGLRIGDLSRFGNAEIHTYASNATGFRWSNGAPAKGVKTRSGLFIGSHGSGFEFAVPADATPRTLKVYLGVWVGRGRLDASLSDGSAAAYADESLMPKAEEIINGVYTLHYRAASAGQTLKVKWTHTKGGGNIELQAATLGTPK